MLRGTKYNHNNVHIGCDILHKEYYIIFITGKSRISSKNILGKWPYPINTEELRGMGHVKEAF